MNEYRVTFGQKYPREPHPYYDRAHHNGFVTILAPSEEAARAYAVARLGRQWAFLYSIDSPTDWSFFPLGEIDRWTVPTEFVESLGLVSS